MAFDGIFHMSKEMDYNVCGIGFCTAHPQKGRLFV